MYGSQSKHAEIRAVVIKELQAHPEKYKAFITVSGNVRRNPKRKNVAASSSAFSFTQATEAEMDAAYESYMAHMAKGGVYGDNIEIMAFCNAFNKDVKVYMADLSYFVKPTHDDGSIRDVMHVAYHVSISIPEQRRE